MALKTIETRAVITASDKTGQTFHAVAAKMRSMEVAAQRASRGVRAAADTATRAGGRAPLAAAAIRGNGGAFGGTSFAFIGGALAVALSAQSISALAVALGERITERTRLHAAGYSEAQIRDVELKAAALNRKFPGIGMDKTMGMMREAGTIVDPKDVDAAMEPLMQYTTLLMKQGKDVSGAMATLRGIDLRGGTNSVAELTKNLEILAKVAGAFSGAISPEETVAFAKRARSAAPGLSDEFILGVMPSLIQKMGGSEAGTGTAAFHRAIVGGKMEDSALKEFARFGLVDPKDLARSKKGTITGLKPGKGLKGRSLAATDPYLWTRDFLLPALRKSGIKSPEETQKALTGLFSKGTAEQVAGIYATQQSSIERDRTSGKRAPGLGEAGYVMAHDAQAQMAAATVQARDVLTTFTSNIYGAGGALEGLGGKIAAVNEDLVKHKDGAAQTAGELFSLGLAAAGLGAIFRTIGLPLLGRAFMSSGAGLAAYGAYQVLKPTPANAMDNELIRQKLYAPELRNPTPMEKLQPDLRPVKLSPGMLSPEMGNFRPVKLDGAAQITNRLEVTLDQMLLARQIDERVLAQGNLSAGKGVSMPPGMNQ